MNRRELKQAGKDTRDLKLGVRVLLKLSALILASLEFCGYESKNVARQ